MALLFSFVVEFGGSLSITHKAAAVLGAVFSMRGVTCTATVRTSSACVLAASAAV